MDHIGCSTGYVDSEPAAAPDLAGFATVPISDNEVAFEVYFTDAEQADLFWATFGRP